MLILLLGLTLLAASISSFSSETHDVVNIRGTYMISALDFEYQAIVTLSKYDNISEFNVLRFTEKMGKELECIGAYNIYHGTTVISSMYCGNYTFQEVFMRSANGEEADFTQEIDLQGISREQIQSSFVATVKSSLFDNIPYKFQFTKQ